MRFSISKESITPTWSVNMGGFSARTEKSQGVHDDLYSKCLMLDDDRTKCLIITLDLVGVDRFFAEEIKGKIEALFSIKKKDVLLSCIHTHSGPSTYPFPSFPSKPEKEYLEFLMKKIIINVQNTIAEAQEGTVEVDTGETYIGMNRRKKEGNEIIIGPNYTGGVDRNLTVAIIKDKNDNVRVVLFNCGCHPTVMSSANLFLSADFPGATCKYIENVFPKSIAIFLQGAGGDVNPAILAADEKYRECSFSDVDLTGRILANDVINITRQQMKKVDISINDSIEEIKLPLAEPDTEVFKDLCGQANVVRKEYAEKMLQLIASGTVLCSETGFQAGILNLAHEFRIVALEGEICHEIGMEICRIFETGNTMISGYSNGIISYIPTAEILKEGGYEAKANCITYGIHSRFAANTSDVIVDNIKHQLPGSHNI